MSLRFSDEKSVNADLPIAWLCMSIYNRSSRTPPGCLIPPTGRSTGTIPPGGPRWHAHAHLRSIICSDDDLSFSLGSDGAGGCEIRASHSSHRHSPLRPMDLSFTSAAARPGPTRRSSWSASDSPAMSSPGDRAPARAAGKNGSRRFSSTTGSYLSATLPEEAPDGVFLVWVRNAAGTSRPVVLNRSEPWWCGPNTVRPGESIRVFGRNLARRPDFGRGFAYLRKPGQPGGWVRVSGASRYSLVFDVPGSLEPGTYELWVHAGKGGAGGGVAGCPACDGSKKTSRRCTIHWHQTSRESNFSGARQAATSWRRGGSTSSGAFNPQRHLANSASCDTGWQGAACRHLQLIDDRTARFARIGGQGWNQAPGRDSLGGRPDDLPDRSSQGWHLGCLGSIWHRHEALQSARSERKPHVELWMRLLQSRSRICRTPEAGRRHLVKDRFA